jgi:ABC-type glycerol-3-phosphate transport system permease component
MPASGVAAVPDVADPQPAPATSRPVRGLVGSRTRAVAARLLASLLLHALLVALATLMVLPLVWTASTSLKSPGDAYAFPPEWFPAWPFYWENYTKGFGQLPFGVFYRNTAFLTVAASVGATFSSALVGYAFARYRAPGSNVVFTVLLATMMIPFQVTMIPQFILFKNLGWTNTFLPLIVPYWLGGGAFYIFLLRQFLRTIPTDFDNAARIDGANDLRIFWHIVLPLSKPALATVAIFNFVHHWNDFLGPLIYLTSDSLYTVSLGLRYMQASGQSGISDVTTLMAMSLVATMPTIVLFFFAQKQFIQGIVTTGLKG